MRLKAAIDSGLIPELQVHVVHPELELSSRENYLYFFQTCALNYQRSSPMTWASALETWNDSETDFVFFPEKVVNTEIEVVRRALLKHKLSLQPEKHTSIWIKIATTLNTYFNNDPRELMKIGEFDTVRVLEIMQKKMKSDFPYLSGPKLSNYSLYILLFYTDLRLKNTSMISIIPDTHVIQASVKLGLIDKKTVNPEIVAESWRELLADTEYSPMDFHAMLWNWSRNNFKPEEL